MTTLMVANDGGHIMQLVTLAPRLPVDGESLWVTVKTPQTESLLEGQRTHWMRPAHPRDYWAVAGNAWRTQHILRNNKVSAVISTGASLALSVLPLARLRGIPCFYVESATRVDGPSMSGRLLSNIPGVRLFTQHEAWATDRWLYGGSVLDGYEGASIGGQAADVAIENVVVTLGTQPDYGFRRLVERLVSILPPDVNVLWQTGCTDVDGLGIEATPRLPAFDLMAAMARADVVVAHAGTGSALAALHAGRLPVLVPRRAELGEHVDDHQLETAGMLDARRLAVVREADELTFDDLRLAATTHVRIRTHVPNFKL